MVSVAAINLVLSWADGRTANDGVEGRELPFGETQIHFAGVTARRPLDTGSQGEGDGAFRNPGLRPARDQLLQTTRAEIAGGADRRDGAARCARHRSAPANRAGRNGARGSRQRRHLRRQLDLLAGERPYPGGDRDRLVRYGVAGIVELKGKRDYRSVEVRFGIYLHLKRGTALVLRRQRDRVSADRNGQQRC